MFVLVYVDGSVDGSLNGGSVKKSGKNKSLSKSMLMDNTLTDTSITDNSNDIFSEYINDIKLDICKKSRKHLVDIVYPIKDIINTKNISTDTMIKKELQAYTHSKITNPSFKHIDDFIIDDNKNNENANDIIIISNINSLKQLQKLSQLTNHYQTITLIKPYTDNPFHENIYCILENFIENSTNDVPPLIIPNISNIIDFSLCVYSFMKYCTNLALSVEDDDVKVNHVYVTHFNISPDDEYSQYLSGLIENIAKVVKD